MLTDRHAVDPDRVFSRGRGRLHRPDDAVIDQDALPRKQGDLAWHLFGVAGGRHQRHCTDERGQPAPGDTVP
ncbi:hypothetical protein Adu01nite_69550 [Paractinoplanes durhamensis]|uniref:Uncharacterized protein n=1 Tax=Paractinoplanes durhamensis TaxID=113563 RepID=A0ABQ3Z708_9ACTN|nr:hypothetical protein Adu01nite_69550 [Actinoplanes durhamensis]